MYFNSLEFAFLFVPITCAIYYFLYLTKKDFLSRLWLILASLFFYGYWDPKYLVLFIVSTLFNYAICNHFLRKGPHKPLLIFGIVLNLLLIIYFKYTNFIFDNVTALFGLEWQIHNIVLPLGISFYTFQKIASLVDCYQRNNLDHDFNFTDYMLFITFFPHLIAGPLIQHHHVMPQFNSRTFVFDVKSFNKGLYVFAIGMFKKIVIADFFAVWANEVFNNALNINFAEAWTGALSYTIQLYYDFSGYSDMAMGLGLIFNFTIPKNFNSPYKSKNIVEFWRRWHITLSNFLRDYLYIPLGGNRKGKLRQNMNLMITMLLGGIWHGAGWNFVIWGGLHGSYLLINHRWAEAKDLKIKNILQKNQLFHEWFSRLLTLFCVVIGWVFFRATTPKEAFKIIGKMFSVGKIFKLPVNLKMDMSTYFSSDQYSYALWLYKNYGNTFGICFILLAVIFIFTFKLKNTQELTANFQPSSPKAVFVGFTLLLLIIIQYYWVSKNEFIYFQF